MNNNQFTQKTLATINNLKADKNGFIRGTYRNVESSRKGVTTRHSETVLKGFIDKLRRDLNADSKGELGFIEVCEMLSSTASIDAILTFYYNGKKEKVILTEVTRNQRLSAFSGRIIKAFADFYGLSEAVAKKITLSNSQMHQITIAAANYYTRTVVRFDFSAKAEKENAARAAKAKSVKDAKAAKAARAKTRKPQANAAV